MDQRSDEESDASYASEGETRGAAKASAPRKAKKKRALDDSTLKKLRAKLKAALYGAGNDYKKFFSRYDKDKQGTLDPDEIKRCVRSAMKVPKSDVSGTSNVRASYFESALVISAFLTLVTLSCRCRYRILYQYHRRRWRRADRHRRAYCFHHGRKSYPKRFQVDQSFCWRYIALYDSTRRRST